MKIKHLQDRYYVCGQVEPDSVRELAEQGFTLIINNRPDNEAADQPKGEDIARAARECSIGYAHIPIVSGSHASVEDVDRCTKACNKMADGKILLFCRSGSRSASLCRQAFGRKWWPF